MTVSEQQQRIQEIARALANAAASNDTADVLAKRIKALLFELADAVVGFPNGPLLQRAAKALATKVDTLTARPPSTGLSHRRALQIYAGELANSFGATERTD